MIKKIYKVINPELILIYFFQLSFNNRNGMFMNLLQNYNFMSNFSTFL